jgi:hypothetical protein
VDIVVRYVTRAGVRLATRNRLFGTVVGLMLGAPEEGEKSEAGAETIPQPTKEAK